MAAASNQPAVLTGATPTPAPRLPGPAAQGAVMGQLTLPSQKEFNEATLCRVGQELVEDIVSKTADVFALLKAIQVRCSEHVGNCYMY